CDISDDGAPSGLKGFGPPRLSAERTACEKESTCVFRSNDASAELSWSDDGCGGGRGRRLGRDAAGCGSVGGGGRLDRRGQGDASDVVRLPAAQERLSAAAHRQLPEHLRDRIQDPTRAGRRG